MTRHIDNIIDNAPGRVAILGAARSGIAAASYFCHRGSGVFVSDTCSRERLDEILRENGLGGVDSEAEGHTEKILRSDLIIISPGVRSDLDILKQAAERKIPVWSEMELGFRVSKAPFLALTGSSGKSTTVSLLASVMSGAGYETALAGNIGTPIVSVTPNLSSDAVVVAEVSSFQLEAIERFRPKVAGVINLMKNHLDRYANEEEYYNAKKRIAENLTNSESLVLSIDDRRLLIWAEHFSSKTRVVTFGATRNDGDCVFLAGGAIRYLFHGKTGVILDDVARMKIGGKHNQINACAAAAMALAYGVDPQKIGDGLCAFGGLPHRLEFVTEIDGVKFYNDSKSTTAESIECAVNAFDAPARLIAGGRDKGCDFSVIENSIRGKVKSIVLIGEAADRMAREWENIVPIVKVDSLGEAVRTAFEGAKSGENVIFSPGCSSFDMFRDYEHRGDMFRETAMNLASRRAGGGAE